MVVFSFGNCHNIFSFSFFKQKLFSELVLLGEPSDLLILPAQRYTVLLLPLWSISDCRESKRYVHDRWFSRYQLGNVWIGESGITNSVGVLAVMFNFIDTEFYSWQMLACCVLSVTSDPRIIGYIINKINCWNRKIRYEGLYIIPKPCLIILPQNIVIRLIETYII